MSDDKKEQTKNARNIVETTMVIGLQDVPVIKKFFEHFDLKMPSALKKAISSFEANQNLVTQKRLVTEVYSAISGPNSIDKLDEMFKPVVEEGKEIAYDLQFNEEMDSMLNRPTQASDPEEPSDS